MYNRKKKTHSDIFLLVFPITHHQRFDLSHHKFSLSLCVSSRFQSSFSFTTSTQNHGLLAGLAPGSRLSEASARCKNVLMAPPRMSSRFPSIMAAATAPPGAVLVSSCMPPKAGTWRRSWHGGFDWIDELIVGCDLVLFEFRSELKQKALGM